MLKIYEKYVKEHIVSLYSTQLQTLAQRKPFTVYAIKGNLILITTSTGNPRNVPLDGTIKAFNFILKHGEITNNQIREHEFSDFNPTYISAILASFPEIAYTTKPIITLRKVKI